MPFGPSCSIPAEAARRFDRQQFVQIEIEPNLPAVRGDLNLLSQCLQNLINNAVKYGGSTTVKVRGRPRPFETVVARNIAPGSTAGLPGLVLPVGLTRGGLPVAIEFDAPAGTDRALLALGLGAERVLGPSPIPNL